MIRAVETGVHIAKQLDLPLVVWKDLHETGGIYVSDPVTGERTGLPGKSRSFFLTHYPDLVLPEDFSDGGWWNRPFEEREDRHARAKRVARELLARHGGARHRVAIVSHGGFYNYLLAEILDLQYKEEHWFIMNNAAITRINFDGEYTWVVYTNRTEFLPGELIT
jgi:broad specificity phosphatase PhoE